MTSEPRGPRRDPTVASGHPVDHPIASVLVPAHDEEQRIEGTLRALLEDAMPHEFDVVVVCNGCQDATAERARAVAGVTVIELETASKIAALRAGDRVAASFPRIYLDADTRLTTDAARALVDALTDERRLVAGIAGRSDRRYGTRGARLYADFKQRLPVFASGIIGAGVYAMNAKGRSRFGEWPDVVGDDQFIFRLFAEHERTTITGHHTTVEVPPDLATLVRRGVRVRRGNAELSRGAGGRVLPAPPAGFGRAIRASLASPRGVASAVTFLSVNAVIRVLARLPAAPNDWEPPRLARRDAAEPTHDAGGCGGHR